MQLNSKSRLPKKLKSGKFSYYFSPECLEKVMFLVQEIGYTEWCGQIYYKVKGNLTDVDNMEIEIIDLFPLSIDTKGFTKSTSETSRLAIPFEGKNNYYNWKGVFKGFIHSHHSMDTFFSATDWDEFLDSSENYPFLSVIVNNIMRPNAHLGIKTESHSEMNGLGKQIEFKSLEISTWQGKYTPRKIGRTVPDDFMQEYLRMKKEEEEKIKVNKLNKKKLVYTMPENELSTLFDEVDMHDQLIEDLQNVLVGNFGISLEEIADMCVDDQFCSAVADVITNYCELLRYKPSDICALMDGLDIDSENLKKKICG